MPRVKAIRCGQPCTTTGKPCKKTVKTAGDLCCVHKEKDVCPCCFEVPLKREESVTPCGHTFHWKCLADWGVAQTNLIKTCPSCRAPLSDEFQWPKVIKTDMFKWGVNNKNHANTYLEFIEESGRRVADDMDKKQLEAIETILSGKVPDGCKLTTRVTLDDAGGTIANTYFTYYMEFYCGFKTRIPITFNALLLPEFSLWDEFVIIKDELEKIMAVVV
jgi:hypothetical protein